MEGGTPDYAVVDLTLKDSACYALVDALRQRGVPLVIYSGYPKDHDVQAAFQDMPWVTKPAGADEVVTAFAGLPFSAAARRGRPARTA